MMQGQPKSTIQNYYDQCISKARQYLESRYPLETCNKDDRDYPVNLTNNSWVVWKIKVKNDLHPLTYLIAVPDTFPDNLPKIYLSKKDYSDISPIPHVDSNRFVCTRDENMVAFNEDKSGEAIETLLDIATQEIINKGVRKENIEDLTDEFLAYWNEGAEFKVLSLINPGDESEILKIVRFAKDFLISKNILVLSEEEAQKWLSPFKIEIDSSSTQYALYIPLENPIQPPCANIDYYRMIEAAGKEHLSAFIKNFGHRNSNLFIFFSFPLKGERILAGWKQIRPKKVAGFRTGKVPLNIEFVNSTMKKIQIVRIDKGRLFRRGGIGIEPSLSDKALAIIGCGSLGGSLAMSLSKTGISKFLLIDKESMEIENVARHECGFLEAGNKTTKSAAMKNRLITHFPHIDCQDYHNDILDLLKKEESLLNSFDLVIVAIANMSVERRLNTLLRQGLITSPLLYLWLEPYGVAGQMLFIHPEKGGCYQCCLENDGEFRYSVAKSNEELYKRETGCQSTFIQYSNLDMEHFVIVACKNIITFLRDLPHSTILHTWLGDLALFKSLGYEISDEWFADSSYSIHKRIIEENQNCKICQNL
ncbi:MAG: ThiF family adenylyltransferase [Actinobacteria bacterium]|nr:ThiF family adenylyltransferase [Actinomycetota bacterium]